MSEDKVEVLRLCELAPSEIMHDQDDDEGDRDGIKGLSGDENDSNFSVGDAPTQDHVDSIQHLSYGTLTVNDPNMLAGMNMTNVACIYEAYLNGSSVNKDTCVS